MFESCFRVLTIILVSGCCCYFLFFLVFCFSLMLSIFSLPALVWLRSTEDVGEELEEMRKEAVEQRNSVKVRTCNGAFGW